MKKHAVTAEDVLIVFSHVEQLSGKKNGTVMGNSKYEASKRKGWGETAEGLLRNFALTLLTLLSRHTSTVWSQYSTPPTYDDLSDLSTLDGLVPQLPL